MFSVTLVHVDQEAASQGALPVASLELVLNQ